MSEETTASGDQSTSPVDSDGLNQETTQTDTVAWESHKKLLSEKKRRDQENADLKAKIEAFEQSKLESEGKKDEALSAQRKKIKELEERDRQREAKYSWTRVSSQIKERAIQDGCTDASKLIKLLDKEDLSSVDVDEEFKVNSKDLEVLMEKARKENPFLFKSKAAPVSDLPPTNAVQTGGTDPATMSKDDILNQLRAMDGLGSI